MRESRIQYNPALSVKDNAIKNGVTEAAIRYYIKVNDLDRNFDRKQNIIADCRKYLSEHPKATRDEICEKTGHSLSTIRKYWEYISTEKELIDFNEEKAKKRRELEEAELQRQMTLLSKIPISVIEQYLANYYKETKTPTAPKKTEVASTSKKNTAKYKGVISCTDEFAYFYQGIPLSNWWTSPAMEYDGHTFYSSEAVYMYKKAMAFNDTEVALKIVEADNDLGAKEQARFKKVKSLGREVRIKSMSEFLRQREQWMYEALELKLEKDERFREILLSEAYFGKTFVEASPWDDVWGIKSRPTAEVLQNGVSAWKGKNLLGKTLTRLRDNTISASTPVSEMPIKSKR